LGKARVLIKTWLAGWFKKKSVEFEIIILKRVAGKKALRKLGSLNA